MMHALLLCLSLAAPSPSEEPRPVAAPGEPGPLPEARELVERLIANQERVEELQASYTYKERSVEYKTRRKGGEERQEKKEEELAQIYPSRELFVRRLLEKDGRPLSAAEAGKEEERIQKLIRKHQERQARKAKRAARGKDGEEEDGGRSVTIRDLLTVCRLRTVGREEVEGRPCLVIAVDGDPERKARTRAEKLAQHLTGTMWVDEADLQVARAEATLSKVKVGGGFVASLKEARVVFDQRRVNAEVWLPTRADITFRGRAFLLKGFDGRVVAEYFDYQKFSTDTEIRIEEPAGGCAEG